MAEHKILLNMGVSLDGFIEGPNGEIDWHCVDDELMAHMNDHLRTMGAFLHGRLMYENMSGAWPQIDAEQDSPPLMTDFARIWLDIPKVVYSRTLEHVEWNSTLVRDVVPDEVRALRDSTDGELSLGGAGLTESFLKHDLVDEFWIYVHPAVIGAGKPLFPAGTKLSLRLVDTQRFGNGVTLLRYER